MGKFFVLALLLWTSFPRASETLWRETVVKAPPEAVWDTWTTPDGIRTFFAPGARIEQKVDGAYEVYFFPEAPEGSKGSEGCTLLEMDAPRHLAFSWNFPPVFPSLRAAGEHTRVTVDLAPAGEGATRVTLRQEGWKPGDDWQKARAYFGRAWEVVLNRLKRRFETGPVNWLDPDGTTAGAIASLAWMTGHWTGATADTRTEEHWSLVNGCMAGFFRQMEGANSVFFEIMAIEPDEKGALLRIRHFGPGLRRAWEERDRCVSFRLGAHSAEEAVFDGVGAQAGERLIYRLTGPDALRITGEFLRNGRKTVETFEFTRR